MAGKKLILSGFIAAAIVFFNASQTIATDRYWQVDSGDWSTAANWGGVEPSSSDTAHITNGGTASITGTGEQCSSLYLGESGTGHSGTISMTGGSLSMGNDAYIGDYGTGTFTQSGGTNSISSKLYLGCNSDSTGTYTLEGTGQLSASYENIGFAGTGTFTQTGGINTVTNNLYFGISSGSSGTYNQSGGTNMISKLYLASATTIALYNLSETGYLSAVYEYLGESSDSKGIFTQTGGINSVSNTLILGHLVWSKGTYNLNGGTLILNSLRAGRGSAVFNFGGGTLQASGDFTTSLPMTLTGDGGNANIDTAGHLITFSSDLSGTGGLNKLGSGALTLSAANTYSGSTIIKAGTIVLDYTAGNTNKLSDTNNLQINGPAVLQIKGGAYTEVVSATALNSGTLELSRPWGGTSILRMNNITSFNGTCMNLASASIADTDTTNTNGILTPSGLACVTVGWTDWAMNSTNAGDGLITAYTSYQIGDQGSWITTDNVSLTGSALLTASRTINTLKINTSGSGQSLNIGPGQILSVNCGGLLFVGNNNYSITNGTIRSMTATNSDLIIQTYGAGSLSIGSIIANDNGNSVLTKAGSGTLTLTGANTYTGNTIINGGTLEIAGGIDPDVGTSLIDVQSGKAVFKTVGVIKDDLVVNTAALATFEVVDGVHEVFKITGSGITQIDSGAVLVVEKFRQNTLNIASGGKLIIHPTVGGLLGSAIIPVPEPSTLVFLSTGVISLIIHARRRRK